MSVSYNKLWKLLIDNKMSKADLRRKINISPNTMTKMSNDKPVNLQTLMKICQELNCDFGDIIEYKKENYKDGK